jgi:DNA-binding transcriptional LysR family regulator
MLDLESVRLFVLAAEFGNLTRAAEAAGTVQPVVSQRLKSLEASLGRKLLERTPRFVRPTEDGAAFLERAKALLASHDEALRFAPEPNVRFALGASDHALGIALEPVLRKLRAALPAGAALDVRLDLSHRVRAMVDAGELDAAIVRREGGGADGEVLGSDPVGWRAAEDWTIRPGHPVPLATLGPACGVRGMAVRRLEAADLPWRESFVGGSCAALLAGVRAGLGVAPMGLAASGDMPDRGPELGLPPLPPSEIVLFARAGSPTLAGAVRALAAALRASLA